MSVDISRLSEGLPAKQQKAVRQEYRQRAKNPTTAFLLCFFLGIFGAHCFYLGRVGQGVLRLVISPLVIPGLIWEIFDLFRVDHEVYERNLKLAERLVAVAMLSVPNPAAEREAIAQLDALAQAREAAPAPATSAAADPAVAPSPSPEAAPAPQPEGEEAPPVWPVAPAALAADAALIGARQDAEAEPAARDVSNAAAPADLASGGIAEEAPVAAFAPAPDAPAEPAVRAAEWSRPAYPEAMAEPFGGAAYAAPAMWAPATPDRPDAPDAPGEMPSAVLVPPAPPVWEQAAPAGVVWASAEEAVPQWPAPAMPDAGAAADPVDDWSVITPEMVAQAAQVANEEAPLGWAERMAAPVTPADAMAPAMGAGLAAASALDLTDRVADIGDPGQLADVGEGTGGRVRVTLPGDAAAEAVPVDVAGPAGEDWPVDGPAAWHGGLSAAQAEENPVLVLIPEEQTEPVEYGDTSMATFGGLAAGLGAAALPWGAESDAGPAPAEPPASPPAGDAPPVAPAAMLAASADAPVGAGYEAHVTEEEHEHPSGGARRVVKRVRVVRRLVVNGQVVQEASAEQVVDADADTAATAASLQQTLGSTDAETLAALAAQAGVAVEGDAAPPAAGTSGADGTPQTGA